MMVDSCRQVVALLLVILLAVCHSFSSFRFDTRLHKRSEPVGAEDSSSADVECPPADGDIACNAASSYRTMDGSCNNLIHPTWGQSNQPYSRLLPAMYDADSRDDARKVGEKGFNLPSARKVSTTLHKEAVETDFSSSLTSMHMLWGQFIDHDFTLTPQVDSITCCNETARRPKDCIPISIPTNDPHWGGTGRTCMEMRRSKAILPDQCDNPQREQFNQLTAFLDASAVYGSDDDRAAELRSFTGGRMKTSPDSLPFDKPGTACKIPSIYRDRRCYAAGDTRCNVWPSLISIHVLFVLEHNRIADIFYAQIKKTGYLSEEKADEKTYQETKKIISAIMQVITYKEYLPSLLGEELMKKFGLSLDEPYAYGSNIDPTIANVFATAAFRFGHAQISLGTTPLEKNYVTNSSRFVPFEEMFNQPETFRQNGGCFPFLRSVCIEPALRIDGAGRFASSVRDELFGRTFDGQALDLPALNNQRGRDHGIPPYHHWRKFCGLSNFSFTDMPDHKKQNSRLYLKLYETPEDVDLYSAAISERPLVGANIGPTFGCLLGLQFQKLKYGDRFWFQSENSYPNPFTSSEIEQLSAISLSRIICQNDNYGQVPADVFKVGSPLVACDQLPSLDLSNWTLD
ncbi:eosinophil peroxidase-like [Watersipora subatra]|uniref:eosinophil peroxidase-like n=1 Tax=Watersipora subatra TaxID=2589382 RepID=UPI00355C5ACA